MILNIIIISILSRSLIYGTVIAIAGGAVLAVILLKNNIVALAGVAVATTFMPPFVNGGLCFALSTHLAITGSSQDYQTYKYDNVEYQLKPAWTPPDNYSVHYSVDMRLELTYLALISFAYTFVNIFFLLLASFIVLKIKEIAPIKHLIPSEHKFFREDIKIYREYQQKYNNNFQNQSQILNSKLDVTAKAQTAINSNDSKFQLLDDNIGRQILKEWEDISTRNNNNNNNTDENTKITNTENKPIQILQNIVSINLFQYGFPFSFFGLFFHLPFLSFSCLPTTI